MSPSGIRGGPACICSAFVPGRIRRVAAWSFWCVVLEAPSWPWESSVELADGEIWSSAIGGGLGSRGELDGDCADMTVL